MSYKSISEHGWSKVSGLLVYAKTNEAIVADFKSKIKGFTIGARTIDLNQDFNNIKAELNSIIDYYLGSNH